MWKKGKQKRVSDRDQLVAFELLKTLKYLKNVL